MELANASNAPSSQVIGGHEVKITGLSWADLGIFEQWMRSNIVEAARTAAQNAASKEEKKLIFSEAFRVAASLTFVVEDAVTIPLGGLLEIAYLALRRHQSDLTPAKVSDMFVTRESLMQVVEETFRLSGLLGDEGARPTRGEAGASAGSANSSAKVTDGPSNK